MLELSAWLVCQQAILGKQATIIGKMEENQYVVDQIREASLIRSR